LKFRKKLTFANVVSCIALFVALGGIGYAAAVLPKNSVGPQQLKRGAVTPTKLSTSAKRTMTGAIGPVGPEGTRGPQGPQGPQGIQGPGAISFEVPVSNGTETLKAFNGFRVLGSCGAANSQLGVAPQVVGATLDMSGFANLGGTVTPVSETQGGGVTFGSTGTQPVIFNVIARNTPNGPEFTHLDLFLKAPACMLRGVLTPSVAG